MSFWDFLWFIFVGWAFVAYLMVMFSIVGDLFRDRDTSGVAKAVWILALVFLPFITALVYLTTRGGAMAERSMQASARQWQQQEAYIREIAGTPATPTEQITQARALFDTGVISQSEYDTLKTKALV